MSTDELSNAFDTLINTHSVRSQFGEASSYQDIVLDEYEKSLFLTEAQNQIVIELYSGRTDKGASFEGTEELRSYLRNLIEEASLIEESDVKGDYRSKVYRLPSDLLFITYEEALINDCNAGCNNNKLVKSVPITHDELHKALENPFRKPDRKRTLRVDIGPGLIEVYSRYNIGEYNIKYLRKPSPIILSDLDGMSIEGLGNVTECELDSSIHMTIVERAVRLALISKSRKSN